MINKTCPYMLNVVPHIFSSINFCVRTVVFFIIEENRIFCKYEINRYFTINSLFFVQICPEQSEILSTDSKNPGASDGYVQYKKILNLLIPSRCISRYMDRTQEKERCTHAESRRFDRVATSFLSIRFLYLYLFCKKYLE